MTTNKTPKVTWSDPPETIRGRRGYGYFWDALREHPGRWARFPGAGTGIHTNVAARHDRDEYECTSRTIDGERVGFVRYIGSGSA